MRCYWIHRRVEECGTAERSAKRCMLSNLKEVFYIKYKNKTVKKDVCKWDKENS